MNEKSKTRVAPLLCALGLVLLPLVSAGTELSKLRLDAAGIEREARLVNLRFDRAASVITLDDAELIEDDAPATGVPEGMDLNGKEEWIENLKKGIVIKKTLLLDDPAAFSGRLVFKGLEIKGNTYPLHISVNGVAFVRPPTAQAAPFARQYIDYSRNDRWFFIDLPAGALRQGENEILLWADSEAASWRVLIALEKEFARGSITRLHHPNRSLKSSDGGKTWSDSKLGPLDSVDGEYSVRISLDRYVKKGEYVSPVMDMVDGSSALKRARRARQGEVRRRISRPRRAPPPAFPSGSAPARGLTTLPGRRGPRRAGTMNSRTWETAAIYNGRRTCRPRTRSFLPRSRASVFPPSGSACLLKAVRVSRSRSSATGAWPAPLTPLATKTFFIPSSRDTGKAPGSTRSSRARRASSKS